MATTSIIASMYNQQPGVLRTINDMFLPSLENNGNFQTQLILIDDCSPAKEETEAIIKKHEANLKGQFGEVIFYRNKSNLGMAASLNHGAKIASGKYLILTNDDVYFPRNSIGRLIQTLEEDYLISGPITNSNGVASYQYCKQAPTVDSYKPEAFKRLENFSDWLWKKMKGQRKTTDNISGFCYATDTVFFNNLGGFNESFRFGYFEDTDLIQRIARDCGQERIAIAMDTFIAHGGVDGFSRSMMQHRWKALYALNVNGFRYAHRWGYWKLAKRWARIISCFLGKNTISELFPKKIEF